MPKGNGSTEKVIREQLACAIILGDDEPYAANIQTFERILSTVSR
jgi:hypothetical protein